MKNLPTLPLLLSAVAVSAAPASGPAELKYDRLAVGYTSGSDTRSYSLTGTALVGGHILVGGSVSDYKVKALADATGRGVTFDLGYKFTLEPFEFGDLIISASFGQLDVSRQSGANSIASQAEQTSAGLTWRQAINQYFEYSLGYSYVSTDVVGSTTIGGTTTRFTRKDYQSLGSLGLRYNVKANADISLGFTFASGGHVWSLSTGYTF
jgi:hypothetical protein